MHDIPDIAPGQAVLWPTTNTEYHATHEAVGSSMLKLLKRSPARFCGLYVDHTIAPAGPTPEMQLGSWVHTLVLEPEQWDSRYVLAPKFDRRTNAGKEAAAKFEMDSLGLEIIPHDDAARVQKARAMAEAVRQHPEAAKLLSAVGPVEQGILWREPTTGILCKVKPDKLIVAQGWKPVIVDLKTTAEPTHDAFGRQASNLGYDLQAALYRDAVEALLKRPVEYVFIAVGKEEPYDVWTWHLDPSWFVAGRVALHDALCLLQQCRESGVWLAPFQHQLNRLALPRWRERAVLNLEE